MATKTKPAKRQAAKKPAPKKPAAKRQAAKKAPGKKPPAEKRAGAAKPAAAKKAQPKAKTSEETLFDNGIVIVDDDLEFNKEQDNEMRRAYLEEHRSQEASD